MCRVKSFLIDNTVEEDFAFEEEAERQRLERGRTKEQDKGEAKPKGKGKTRRTKLGMHKKRKTTTTTAAATKSAKGDNENRARRHKIRKDEWEAGCAREEESRKERRKKWDAKAMARLRFLQDSCPLLTELSILSPREEGREAITLLPNDDSAYSLHGDF